jgi:hypothetical protein
LPHPCHAMESWLPYSWCQPAFLGAKSIAGEAADQGERRHNRSKRLL